MHIKSIIALVALGSIAAACGGDGGTGPVTAVALVPSGPSTFTGTVGTVVSPNASVKVVGSNGQPFAGTAVTFTANGGGQVTAGTATSSASGIATVGSWTLGTGAGSQTLTASAPGMESVTFTALSAAGAPSQLTIVSGNNQQTAVGSAVGPLAVSVTDQHNNPAGGASVSFQVTSGGGQIAMTTGTANPLGVATVGGWILGSTAGVNTLRASVSGGGTQTFTATAVDTGGTISGTVTLAPDATRVQARLRSGFITTWSAATQVKRPHSTKGGIDLSSVDQSGGLETMNTADTRGNLIVSFHKDAFSLPQDARAYSSASLRTQATTAFYSALLPFETNGMLQRREVSPAIAAVRVDVAPGADVEEVKRLLRQDPRIADVEENRLVSLHREPVRPAWGRTELIGWSWNALRPSVAVAPPSTELFPSDPLFEGQMWHYRMIDLPRAWKVTTGSSGVRVAVVDAGIRPDHPGVAPLLATTGHYDFTDGTTVAFSFPQPICGTALTFNTVRGTAADIAAPRNVAQAPLDLFLATNPAFCWTLKTDGSHGTHVAGTIGSPGNDGIGGTGVNWNVQLIAVRVIGVTGQGFTFDIAQGILYSGGLPATFTGAAPGSTVQMPAAHIMNLSLGGPSSSTVQANAIAAAAANTLIIAAAGNSSSSVPNFPAALPEPISVVSLAPDLGLSSFTSVGTTVDVAAPGGDNNRFWSSAGVLSTTWNYQTSTPNYSYFNGTSMAAPHVAGVAALVVAASPGLTPAQLRARIINGAIDIFSPGIDTRSGAGLVNAYNAVTGTRGPTANTIVRAIDAGTGAVRKSVNAAADGRFTLANLTAGSYFVVAGQDEGTDATQGIPGRRLGWFGTAGGIGSINLTGSATVNSGVTIGSPVEVEPNDATAQANVLVVNSWVSGNLTSPDVRDVYSVRIPAVGQYSFETSGVLGACFSALEVDTVLRLTDQNGTTVANNDDTAFPTASYPGTFCSLITTQLQPGTYFVEVTPAGNDFGSYRLHVRSGP